MGKSIAAALLCLPLAAHAGKLVVEYTGTVSSIDRGSSSAEIPPYSVGDTIEGSLIIDTALAPVDEQDDDAQVGRYVGGSPGLDFVLGAEHPPGFRGPADFVIVHDDWSAPATGAREDGIVINDSSIGTDGDFNLLLGLQRPNALGQIFGDDSLSQSFVVEREPGTTLWGFVERGFGELWNIVNFTVDRLSLTPLVCKP
jgi:hypothetical protein